MKARPDCIVCMFQQALKTARVVSASEEEHLRVLSRIAELVAAPDLEQTPAALSKPAYEAVAEITGHSDPYRDNRRETNRLALRILPRVRALVGASPNPLQTALQAAAAGNVIDQGIGHRFDIEKDVEKIMTIDFAVNAIDDFRTELQPGRKLLYLGDNAGEIVLDTLLVEQLLARGVDVTYTVKSGPIINDALRGDAEEAGMTDLVRVIETGSNDIGVNWNNVSAEFKEAFDEADVILGKGHGNFETCNDRPENIYFLLKAKCAMVARELGVQLGDLVFKRANQQSAGSA